MRAFIGMRVTHSAEVLGMLRELDSLDYVKTVEPDNLHLNLKFLGEIDERQEKELEPRLARLAGFGPLDVYCSGVDGEPDKKFVRVILSRCGGERLEELRYRLRELVDDFLPGSEKGIHLTLGRVKRKPDWHIGEFFSRHAQFSLLVRVERVELVKSELLPDGPAYKTVFSVRL